MLGCQSNQNKGKANCPISMFGCRRYLLDYDCFASLAVVLTQIQYGSVSRSQQLLRCMGTRLTLEKTDMFYYMQEAWNQHGISVESRKFHINTILWKFHVPHYLCRDRISTVELEWNLYGTESH